MKWVKGLRTVCAELRNNTQIYTACDSIELTTGEPVLTVKPSQLSYLFIRAKHQILPEQAVLQIANSGNDQVLSWRIVSAPEWTRVAPTSGTTPSGAVISLNPAEIPTSPGTYSGIIRVAMDTTENVRGSPYDVVVTLTVVEDLPYAVFLPAVLR